LNDIAKHTYLEDILNKLSTLKSRAKDHKLKNIPINKKPNTIKKKQLTACSAVVVGGGTIENGDPDIRKNITNARISEIKPYINKAPLTLLVAFENPAPIYNYRLLK
jgi:hypothetical protein